MEFLILVCVSAAFASGANVMRSHYAESVFKLFGDYFNPTEAKHKIYRYGDPARGERFYGSSDLFVIFFDGEKFLILLSLKFFGLSILFYNHVTPWLLLDWVLIICVTWLSYRLTKWVLILFGQAAKW